MHGFFSIFCLQEIGEALFMLYFSPSFLHRAMFCTSLPFQCCSWSLRLFAATASLLCGAIRSLAALLSPLARCTSITAASSALTSVAG